jgi:hypothetical protein
VDYIGFGIWLVVLLRVMVLKGSRESILQAKFDADRYLDGPLQPPLRIQ